MTDRDPTDRGPLDFGPDDERPGDGAPDGDHRERRPAPGPGHDEVAVPRPAGASRYGWFVGVAVVLLIAVASLNAFRTEGRGARGVEVGEKLPAFAIPLALSPLEGDANVATGSRQGDAGARPACSVRGPQVLNICALAEEGPVVLAFLATRGGACEAPLDLIDSVAGRYPGVQFAAVSIRGDRSDLRELVRTRGWSFPVGHDRDGVLANLYSVAVCPQVTFARQGGEVLSTSFGALTADELDTRVQRIVTASERRGWRAPES